MADPLKQEAVQDPPQPIIAPATRFATSALLEGMTEVRIARLAQSRAQNAAVRRLAGLLLSDQERSNAALGAIAARRSITAPKELDAGHRTLVKSLEGWDGAAFDRAFLSQTVASHDRAIALFTAAAAADDTELATYAHQALPILQAHRDSAKTLQTTLGPAKTT